VATASLQRNTFECIIYDYTLDAYSIQIGTLSDHYGMRWQFRGDHFLVSRLQLTRLLITFLLELVIDGYHRTVKKVPREFPD